MADSGGGAWCRWPLKHLDRARRLERQPAAEHPVQDHSEGVDVARRRDRLTRRLLRRHVGSRSEERSLLRERVGAAHASDPEVGDLGVTLLVEDDVRRLQVTVDDPAVVRMGEPRGDLARDRLRARVVQRLAGLETVLQRSSGQVLEDHVRPRALAAVVEQAADVRVGERRDRACLSLEALAVGPRPEQLQGDPAVELEVVGEPDLGHAPGAEPFLEPVAARDRLLHGPE